MENIDAEDVERVELAERLGWHHFYYSKQLGEIRKLFAAYKNTFTFYPVELPTLDQLKEFEAGRTVADIAKDVADILPGGFVVRHITKDGQATEYPSTNPPGFWAASSDRR